MALLVEDPVDIPNNAVDIPNNAVDIPDDVVDIDRVAELHNNAAETHDDKEPINAQESPADVAPVAKRKPGRPAGSRNKEQGKARKPRVKTVEVIEEPIEEVFEDPIEPPEPQYQRIPTAATTSKEERMLRLLSDHAQSRRSRKVALWKSWF